MQTFIVILAVAGALSYAAWYVYDIFREGGDPCKGCDLREKCHQNSQNSCHKSCHCK